VHHFFYTQNNSNGCSDGKRECALERDSVYYFIAIIFDYFTFITNFIYYFFIFIMEEKVNVNQLYNNKFLKCEISSI